MARQAVAPLAQSHKAMVQKLREAAANKATPEELNGLAQAVQATRTAVEQKMANLGPEQRAALAREFALEGF